MRSSATFRKTFIQFDFFVRSCNIYPPLLQEHESVRSLTQAAAEEFRLKHSIFINGNEAPKPITAFKEAPFPLYVKEELERQGFKNPTPIQSQGIRFSSTSYSLGWPVALLGRDMVGIAETGSGKTLAYILPGIVHVMGQDFVKPGESPIVLVLAPTRELALQIEAECKKFARVCRISTTAVYGGVPRGPQQSELQRGVDILIATPGRLIDFLEQDVINLKRVSYLVLDEADRMLVSVF